jgi:hypothetical protein
VKFLVRIGLVIVVIVAVVAVFNRYRSAGHCTVLGAGVAHADTETDCLHQDALSTSWAETQQRQMAAAGAPVTTGWLFTDTTGEDHTPIASGREGSTAYSLVMQYLAPYAGGKIRDRPPGSQAAEHVEAKAAALMRNAGDTYGVVVINNPRGPCEYASGPGCDVVMELILPKGSEIVVWWPGGRHDIYLGEA